MLEPLRFAVNERVFELPAGSVRIDESLLHFLRDEGYTGCKQVCGEGGCGACTVIVGHWDHIAARVRHVSVAACLVPLPFVHERQVITIEGLANLVTEGTHPVCDAFDQLGASQCGFCTPGFIMALSARLESAPLGTAELERLFDGNLCRCTGYRPILDAAAVFCDDHAEIDEELGSSAAAWRTQWQQARRLEALFPDDYKKAPRAATLRGARTTWFQPVSLDELLPREPEDGGVETHTWANAGTYTKMVSGNTDIGYTERLGTRAARNKVSLNHVRELHTIEWGADRVEIGAGVSIHDLVSELEERIPKLPDEQTSGLKALHNQCRFFANNQIRNVATVGGGIVNFSHYSDLIPVWVATRATLLFRGPGGSEAIRLSEQSDADGMLTFRPREDQVLVSVSVPFSTAGDRVASFKYARRRMDSITFLSSTLR